LIILIQVGYLHALAKLTTVEGIELKSLRVWVRRLTADLFASARLRHLY